MMAVHSRMFWCLVLVLAVGPPSAVGQTYTWANPTFGTYETGSNWVGGTAPPNSSTTTVAFPDGSYTVSTTAAHTLNTVTASPTGNNKVTLNSTASQAFNMAGATPTVNVSGGTLELQGVMNAATLQKTGGGDFRITSPNSGQLTVGTLTIVGGRVILAHDSALPATAAVVLSGGGLTLLGPSSPPASVSAPIGALSGSGGTVSLGNFANPNTLTINQNSDTTFSGGFFGTSNHAIVKQGSGTLTLAGSGDNQFIGTTQVLAGVLSANRSGGYLFDGKMQLAGTGELRLQQSGQFNVTSNTAGVQFFGTAGVFNVNNQSVTLTYLTGDGGTVKLGTAGTAALTVNMPASGTLSAAVTGSGTIRKEGAGFWTLNGDGSAFSGQLVVAGGRLNLGNTLGGTVTVSSGTFVTGTGTVGTLMANSGSTISPGSSPGTITATTLQLKGGSAFVWELQNATGSAGVGYDQLRATGSADLSTASTANPWTIRVAGLLNNGSNGRPANYSETQAYDFKILDVPGGATGFNSAAVTIDRSLLDPYITASNVQLSLDNRADGLYLVFSPVPEPSGVLAVAGFVGAVVAVRRYGRRHPPREQHSGRIDCTSSRPN